MGRVPGKVIPKDDNLGVLKSTMWHVCVGGYVGVEACPAVGRQGTRPDPAAAGSDVLIRDMVFQILFQFL